MGEGGMIRVITISREYGSGGASVARVLTERLRWRLLDNSLITDLAKQAKVHPALARRYDENVDPWFHRLLKALWKGGYEGAASRVESDVFDADAMAALWSRVIEEAAAIGQCVIVGHGGQCILQGRNDVFHVSLYAPMGEKLQRIRDRVPQGTNLAALAEDTDLIRETHIRRYFDRDWRDRSLYHLIIRSSLGVETVADTILCAAGLNVAAGIERPTTP